MWQGYLGFMCALLKFGAGTVVSLMLHQTPVLLRGVRHTLTFAVALLLIQSCPGDLVNTFLNGPTHLMVCVANALYKARKFTFALEASVAIGAQIPLTVLVTWLAVEGSSSARRVESVLHRFFHHPSPTATWYDFVHGVFLPLLRQAVPIVVLSLASRAALMAGDGGEHDATGGSANVLLGYGVSKVAVFGYLLHRYVSREWHRKADLSLLLHPRCGDEVSIYTARMEEGT